MTRINAVVLAGGQMKPEDPLLIEGINGNRNLINIHGKPMVQWVIDALDAVETIEEIYVMGLTEVHVQSKSKPLHFLPDQGDIFLNIRSGVLQATHDHPLQSKVIIASGDIPALLPKMVNWLITQVEADPTKQIYYTVVHQKTMDERFPAAKRSYVRFKDMAVCGGDLNVVDKKLFDAEKPVWMQLTAARKRPLRQAALLGFDNLIRVAMHQVTLEKTVQNVCNKLSITGKALLSPYAEMAMDADKPHQLQILRQDLEKNL